MKSFRSFAVASAATAFALAVLGSWVRINGAGLTCPDWPLCRGSLIPVLQGGVVLEYSHRLAALIVAPLVLGVFVSGWRVRNRIPGLERALIALAFVFALQVVLGGATVTLKNSPPSVVLHWGVAMLLLATLTTLVTAAFAKPRLSLQATNATTVALLGFVALLAFVTMCLGAFVSSS